MIIYQWKGKSLKHSSVQFFFFLMQQFWQIDQQVCTIQLKKNFSLYNQKMHQERLHFRNISDKVLQTASQKTWSHCTWPSKRNDLCVLFPWYVYKDIQKYYSKIIKKNYRWFTDNKSLAILAMLAETSTE